jgi:hypothetical protein
MNERSFIKWLARVEELTGMEWDELDGRFFDVFKTFKMGISPEYFVQSEVLYWPYIRTEELEEKACITEYISMGPGYREFEGQCLEEENAQDDAYWASVSNRLRNFEERKDREMFLTNEPRR